ncbi:hypothetical protein ACLRDC_05115 [Gluconacetobacter sacchari]|uniref:Uncharacterized protein n=2 Tax=Gluconacetobacter sacchari TaxID=92759 RepID=A0A7W4I9E4_9PROT|nr:hypothetical protein [Gluconacetobacter sacchari]MBB2158709.1 hypothetical protein [Gluconacetobacter sacchari]GBQ21721.1 hypothetical protein AA12717_0979 [Gluconacetobacter sacchari DSM 12717]
MPVPSSKPWFAAKSYGIGSGLPIAWQGWVTLILFVGALLSVSAIPVFFHSVFSVVIEIAGILGVLAVFLVVCAAKTDGGWAWRWGGGDA